MSADPRNDSKGGWIHEDEFREVLEELARQEKKDRGGSGITFESFVGPQVKNSGVQTALESVEELFQRSLAAQYALKPDDLEVEDELDILHDGRGPTGPKHEDEPLVDLSSIAQVAEDDDYGSEEDVARTKALT